MRKVIFILGTRPEAIKLAPPYLELRRRPESFTPRLWATGQHRELLSGALGGFGLVPDRDLELMRPGQRPAQLAARTLSALEAAFTRERSGLRAGPR